MRKKNLWMFIICIVILACTACGNKASKLSEPGSVFIVDQENLINDSQKEVLMESMEELAAYGHVLVYIRSSRASGSNYASSFAASTYDQYFGKASGFMFLIDMKSREIWIETDGSLGKVIGRGEAKTITNAVYRYASDGNYFQCANEAVKKATRTMNGKFLFSKLKLFSNAILAILISLLVNFMVLRLLNRKKEVKASEYAYANKGGIKISNREIKQTGQSVVYLNNGSSRSGGGGFRGGGGGHHSHGGGHRF